MRIRNLSQYLDLLLGETRGKSFQDTNQALLYLLQGDGEDLDYRIKYISSFATDSNAQIFYELLQNADDAGATKCYIGFDENGLIVMNNGEPFFSDNKTTEPSRLRSFLSKGKSVKKEGIGKHGQGSKLLFDLLLDTKRSIISEKDSMGKLVKDGLKGPMLFSWSNLPSLLRMRSWTPEYNIAQDGDCKDSSIPLLTKIIYTFYPAALHEKATINGIETTLFSKQELTAFVKLLNTAIEQMPDHTAFQKGSAIYIPLGEGRHKKLREELSGKVAAGLSTSLVLLPQVDHIQINDRQYGELTTFKQEILELSADEHTGEKAYTATFYYPVDPQNINNKLSNFFQYFPITEEVHGLKFIINSEAYNITSSRQTIVNDERTTVVIQEIGGKIAVLIKETANAGNTDKLLQIIGAILASEANEIKKDLIKEHLHDRLIEIIKKHIPTDRGMVDMDNPEGGIAIKDSQLEVTAEQLGKNMYWVNEVLKPYAGKLNLPIWNIQDILNNFETDELRAAWIKTLDRNQYSILLDELSEISDIDNVHFVKFSDGKVYSIHEIREKSDLLLLDNRTLPLCDIFDKADIVYGGREILGHKAIYDRILPSQGILYLKERILNKLDFSSFIRDDKWRLFQTLRESEELDVEELRKLEFFCNKAGVLLPLSALAKTANQWVDSCILDTFYIHPAEVFYGEFDEYLMQAGEAWDILLDEWSVVTDNLTLDTFSIIANDLQKLYEASDSQTSLSDNYAWLLNQQGEITGNKDVFFNEQMYELSPKEYKQLTAFLEDATDLFLLHPDVVDKLKNSKYKFASYPSGNLRTVASRFKEVEGATPVKVEEEALRALFKCGNIETPFFDHFKLKQSDNGQIEIWSEEPGVQFFTENAVVVKYLSKQDKYFLLPENLLSIFKADKNLWGDFGDKIDVFATKLIEDFGAMPEFIDLVCKCSISVKLDYIKFTPKIDLYSDDDIETYSDRYEGKLIQLATDERQEDLIKDKIFINDKPLSYYSYRDEVKVSYLSKELNFSLSYLLPEYEGKSDALQQIREKLKPLRMGRLFTAQRFDIKLIEDGIFKNKTITHPDQLVFIVAYRKTFDATNNRPLDSLEWKPTIDEQGVLNEFFSREVLFPEELSSRLFEPSFYILVDDDRFLLEEEKIPYWVREWVNSPAEDTILKKEYLYENGLRKEGDPAVELRQCIFNNKRVSDKIIDEVVRDRRIADNTFEWIQEHLKNEPVTGENLNTLGKLINRYCKSFHKLPGAVLSMIFAGEISYRLSPLNQLPDPKCYLTSGDADPDVVETAQSKYKLTIVEAKAYTDSDEYRNQLNQSGIKEAVIERTFTPKNNVSTSEWKAEQYLEWKKKHTDYSILSTEEEIPFQYYIIIGNDPLFIGEFPKGNAARDQNEQSQVELIIFPKGEDLLSAIKKHKNTLFPDDKRPFTELLEAFAIGEGDWQLLNAAKAKGLTGESIQKLDSEMLEVVTTSGLTPTELQNRISSLGYDLGKELGDEELETLKELLHQTDAEKLKAILRNLDKIEQLLESEDDESTPNLLLGHIGEVLVKQWLEDKHGVGAVTHESFKGETWTRSPYDIRLKIGEDTYLIDVKTTQKPIKESDSSVAFFIQDSEYKYIKDNITDPYFIYRISLKDLGLLYLYKKIHVQAGQSFEEVIHLNHDQIQLDISDYLSSEKNKRDVRQKRLAFRVEVPREKDERF